MYIQFKRNFTFSFSLYLFMLMILAGIFSSCSPILQTLLPTPTQEFTLVPPTKLPSATPTITMTPEPTATATEVPTPTEVVTPTPKPTIEVDELGIRVEFPLGQGMTRQELKASVQWFYDLSDWELNQITSDKLWSSDIFPNDSRPRDPSVGARSALLKYHEDLGWYFTMRASSGIGVNDWHYFNVIYLGTTVDRGENHPPLYVSAFGTKDWFGKRFVIYANTGLYRYTDCGDFQSGTSSNRTVDLNMVKPVFNPKEGNFNLLNTNRGDVINLVLNQRIRLNITKDQMTKCGPVLVEIKGVDNLMNLIIEQRKGLSSKSAKDLVDSSLGIKFNKLPQKLSLENYNNLVGSVKMTLPKNPDNTN